MPRRLLLLVPLVALLLATGCGTQTAVITTAPLPPASAPPEVVVRRWLDAVNAGDEAAGRALSTPRFADAEAATTDGWFANTLSITDVRTAPATPITGLQSNRDHRQVTYVRVALMLEQKKEVSFRDGPLEWGFVLVRDRPGERWRINEQGLG